MPIDALRPDIVSCLGNLGRVRFESMNRIVVTDAQGRRQLPVTTAKMDHDATLHTGGIENLFGQRYRINPWPPAGELFCLRCTSQKANS